MNRLLYILIFAAALPTSVLAADPIAPYDPDGFTNAVKPFLKKYCADCHNAKVKKAKFRIDDIQPVSVVRGDLERWEKALEMVSLGDMPPEKKPQPPRPERRRFVEWVTGQLKALGRGPSEDDLVSPHFANRVNHEDLFSGEYKGPAYTRSRVWRINAHIYKQLVAEMQLKRDFVPPLQKLDGEGFDDYALLYADEATIRTMIQNGKKIAMNLVYGRLKGGKREAKGRLKELNQFATLQESPTREQMDSVVRYVFRLLLRRTPTDAELNRYITGSLEPSVRAGGADVGLRGFLDGEITDAIDLVHRLAKSERVRQSFIRHVFRFWMGRNETLSDSPTLMTMDTAYVKSDGSFKETLVALFTSDSFLYRK